MSNVRTSLDLPDPLFRELKARAAMEGVKLKELIRRFIETGLRADASPVPGRSPFPVIGTATGKPIPALTSEEIHRLEEQEDLEKFERSLGR
jgi:hypothetical protein